MERMYQEYGELAEFYLVYIAEKQEPQDGRTSAGAKKGAHHEQYSEERGGMVARRLIRDKKLTFACLIDGPNAAGARAWQGLPDSVFVVRTDGKLGVAARRGLRGLSPAIAQAKAWLAEYKKTGIELTMEPPQRVLPRRSVAARRKAAASAPQSPAQNATRTRP